MPKPYALSFDRDFQGEGAHLHLTTQLLHPTLVNFASHMKKVRMRGRAS